MGYTHYFRFITECPKNVFASIRDDIRKIVEYTNKDNPNTIRGWDGIEEPEFEDDFISFNGNASTYSDCETFMLERDRIRTNYCKTQRYNYDDVVAASLLIAKYHCPSMYLNSDDRQEGYVIGAEILKKIFGFDKIDISYNDKIDKVDIVFGYRSVK